MLDMFWLFDENGKSYLDEKLKAEGVDTVVIAGLWTDECIIATACKLPSMCPRVCMHTALAIVSFIPPCLFLTNDGRRCALSRL